MYAILSHGGRQYRVSAGDRLIVDRLEAAVGSVVALEPVLLTGGDGTTALGKDLDGVRVAVTVVAHPRGRKLRIFKYKAKKRSRKMAGYRSNLTELRVESILAKGIALPKPVGGGGGDDTQRPAAAESPAAATRAAAPAAKPRTRAAASATAGDAPSAAATDAPTKAAPIPKSSAKRAVTPEAAAPTADAVVVEEPASAESEPAAGSADAKPKTAARTPKAAPKTSKRSTPGKDRADDKETGDGA
jgi:large subunit ribosomal protein L21